MFLKSFMVSRLYTLTGYMCILRDPVFCDYFLGAGHNGYASSTREANSTCGKYLSENADFVCMPFHLKFHKT